MNTLKINDKFYLPLILTISLVVPAVVALLFFGMEGKGSAYDLTFLPAVNAGINSMVAILLLIGRRQIKAGKQLAHRKTMLTAFFLSILFLISYLTYHSSGKEVKFGGAGMISYLYYFILITHILLSAVVVPLVLLSIYFGLTGRNARHRKVTRWSWPIWLYVAVTGVIVYLMAHPFNPAP